MNSPLPTGMASAVVKKYISVKNIQMDVVGMPRQPHPSTLPLLRNRIKAPPTALYVDFRRRLLMPPS